MLEHCVILYYQLFGSFSFERIRATFAHPLEWAFNQGMRAYQVRYIAKKWGGVIMDREGLLVLELSSVEEIGANFRSILQTNTYVQNHCCCRLCSTSKLHLDAVIKESRKWNYPILATALAIGSDCTHESCDLTAATRQFLPRSSSLIVILPQANAQQALATFDAGASDVLHCPLDHFDVIARTLRWLPRQETRTIARAEEPRPWCKEIRGRSAILLQEIDRIPLIAQCFVNVLIQGETGTGKELCARAIHSVGSRKKHPFVAVNCGAFPGELIENELFGHKAGAYTHAKNDTSGLLQEAEKGTLFLDEIDTLPCSSQVKLLRLLQEKEYRPIGSSKVVNFNARIIAASNCDLRKEVEDGRFREDLFYRLNVVTLRLPPLRLRQGDVELLAHHFVMKARREHHLPPKQLSMSALQGLSAYHWPGNVRELENVITRAVLMSPEFTIHSEDLDLSVTDDVDARAVPSFREAKRRVIDDFEAGYIRSQLGRFGGNVTKAATASGQHRRAFQRLMNKHAAVLRASSRR